DAWPRPGRDQDDVGGQDLPTAVGVLDQNPIGTLEASDTVNDADALSDNLVSGVRRLGHGQRLDPRIDDRVVHADAALVRLRVVDADTELAGLADLGDHLGSGDQGLAGDTGGEHGRPTAAVPLHQTDVGTELGGDQRRFVPARATADDHDTHHGCPFSRTARATPDILVRACLCTRLTPPTSIPRRWRAGVPRLRSAGRAGWSAGG